MFAVCYFDQKFTIERDSCFKNVTLPMRDVSLLTKRGENVDFLVKGHERHKADRGECIELLLKKLYNLPTRR